MEENNNNMDMYICLFLGRWNRPIMFPIIHLETWSDLLQHVNSSKKVTKCACWGLNHCGMLPPNVNECD